VIVLQFPNFILFQAEISVNPQKIKEVLYFDDAKICGLDVIFLSPVM
jgi:hypothetical protein